MTDDSGERRVRRRKRRTAGGELEHDNGTDRGDGRTSFGTFPAGVSGNAAGRPAGSRNASTILRDVLAQTVTLNTKDGPVPVSKLEAAVAQLVNCGLVDKNVRALERIIALAFAIEGKAGEKQQGPPLGAADRAVLESFAARLRDSQGSNI